MSKSRVAGRVTVWPDTVKTNAVAAPLNWAEMLSKIAIDGLRWFYKVDKRLPRPKARSYVKEVCG